MHQYISVHSYEPASEPEEFLLPAAAAAAAAASGVREHTRKILLVTELLASAQS